MSEIFTLGLGPRTVLTFANWVVIAGRWLDQFQWNDGAVWRDK